VEGHSRSQIRCFSGHAPIHQADHFSSVKTGDSCPKHPPVLPHHDDTRIIHDSFHGITALNPTSSSTGNQHGNVSPNTTHAFPPSDSLSRTHPDAKPRKVCRAEPSVVKRAILVGGSSSDCCLDGAALSDHLLALFAFSHFTSSVRLS
jgi:hypothetical protein